MTQESSSYSQERVIEITEALDTIHARETKPVEVMVSAINLPIDEEGCGWAGEILKQWETRSQLDTEACKDLAAKWSHRSSITSAYNKLKSALESPISFKWRVPAVFSVIAAVVLLVGFVATTETLVRQIAGGLAAAFIILPWGFWIVEWVIRYQTKNTETRRARRNLATEIENALNQELSGLLDGHKRGPHYGKWYIDYPLAASYEGEDDDHGKRNVERFKKFLEKKTPLAHLVEEFDKRDQSRISQFLTRNVRQRIRSGDWIQTDRDHSFSSNGFGSSNQVIGSQRKNGGNKNVVLIPVGHEENMKKYKVNEGDFRGIPGVNLTFQGTSGTNFALCCMYIIMRSPTEEFELGRWQLYEEIYGQSSALEKEKHDPSPDDSKLFDSGESS